MSSSAGISAPSMPPIMGPSLLSSPREERHRPLPAVTSKEAPMEPSCLFQIRGPPVFLSGVSLPSIRTFEPFLRYWLQISACLPHVVTRNHLVSLTCSPLPVVYWRFVATENDVTACPEGV